MAEEIKSVVPVSGNVNKQPDSRKKENRIVLSDLVTTQLLATNGENKDIAEILARNPYVKQASKLINALGKRKANGDLLTRDEIYLDRYYPEEDGIKSIEKLANDLWDTAEQTRKANHMKSYIEGSPIATLVAGKKA